MMVSSERWVVVLVVVVVVVVVVCHIQKKDISGQMRLKFVDIKSESTNQHQLGELGTAQPRLVPIIIIQTVWY